MLHFASLFVCTLQPIAIIEQKQGRFYDIVSRCGFFHSFSNYILLGMFSLFLGFFVFVWLCLFMFICVCLCFVYFYF
jgi:hypothetical protein